jgi:hypothetical protein
MTTDGPEDIKPGDIYEDCAFQPILCTYNEGGEISGISLIDGSYPRWCDIGGCGPVKLSIADVIAARTDWTTYLKHREAIAAAEYPSPSA